MKLTIKCIIVSLIICIELIDSFFFGRYGLFVRHFASINDNNTSKRQLIKSTSNEDSSISEVTENSSLLPIVNLIQELFPENEKIQLFSEKLREQFIQSFSKKYGVSLERLRRSMNITARLENIPSTNDPLMPITKDIITNQLQSLDKKPTTLAYYNEPMTSLDDMKYPFIFPIDTIFLSYPQSKQGLSASQSTSNNESIQQLNNDKQNERLRQIRMKGQILNLRNVLNRLKIPTSTEIRRDEESSYQSILRRGLRLETLQWRLGKLSNRIFSALLRDTELMIDDVTDEMNQLTNIEQTIESIPDDINFQYENYTKENLSRKDITTNEIKVLHKRWRLSMSLLESVSDQSLAIIDKYPSIRSNRSYSYYKPIKINYPLLIHSAVMLSQATYNLRLSSIVDAIQPVVAARIGTVLDRIMNVGDIRENNLKDVLLLNQTLENAQFYVVKAIQEMFLPISKPKRFPRSGNETGLKPPDNIQNILTTLGIKNTKDDLKIEEDLKRCVAMTRNAIGCPTYTNEEILLVRTVQSDKACAILTYDKRIKLATIAFRGTKDPMDIITDISFTSKVFHPPSMMTDSLDSSVDVLDDENDIEMNVHSGFLSAFESIIPQMNDILKSFHPLLNPFPSSSNNRTISNSIALNRYEKRSFGYKRDEEGTPILLLTGHSMGGALAQLAGAYYAECRPYLITIASPAVGNRVFCNYIEKYVYPNGGIRIWNEFDIVPYVALIVGFEQPGIPIKLNLSTSAKSLFREETNIMNPLLKQYPSSLGGIYPHILYQIGTTVYVFPVLGIDLIR